MSAPKYKYTFPTIILLDFQQGQWIVCAPNANNPPRLSIFT